jgi:hypothetical protein
MASRFTIKPTSNSPFIEFDPEIGSLTIVGQSHPEDPQEFYQDLVDILEEYCRNPKQQTKVIVDLEYMNTGTSRVIYNVFRKLETIVNEKREVEVHWRYEDDDDDMLDAGQIFSELTKLKFKMIGVN